MKTPTIYAFSIEELRSASIKMIAAVSTAKLTGAQIPEAVWSEYAAAVNPHSILLMISLIDQSVKSGAISVAPMPSGPPN